MARIINLRQARKQQARDRKRTDADAKAARHGETRAVREARQAEEQRMARVFDGHAREDAAQDGSGDD
ncbi:DUF4169 family protein [Paracoccus sp. TK19116]|uniref:DUF4169 family protein n=1 Tax=Paracoccus albicereus TaxID=2922394 RepID=A0ABT1MSJ5_9RHOB|nr:DUF4169 family protein [Paracoccus albicereus]MCQ0971156.1 DUF4169 family protein [Paracoccus albicereus]